MENLSYRTGDRLHYTRKDEFYLLDNYLYRQTENNKCLMHFKPEKLIERPCHILRTSSLFWHLAFSM